MRREACADWPCVLCPAPGCFPLAAPLRANERILHLANSDDGVVSNLGFDLIASEYRRIFWPALPADEVIGAACEAAQAMRPTIVFLNLQDDGILCAQDIEALRECCDPSVVIIDWDGDQHFEPTSPEREWFVELGRVCDSSLVVNTEHPAIYAKLGVQHPGFFEVGVDPAFSKPTSPAVNVPPIVLLAGGCHPVHSARTLLVRNLARTYGPEMFGVYGYGWNDLECGHQPLEAPKMAPVYAAARAALSISARNDLPRYTSHRLLIMLASGAISVVESFPDCEGRGLVGGVNCLLWNGWDSLQQCLRAALDMTDDEQCAMRTAAKALGREHTHPAHVPELLAIVDAIRETR